MISSSRSLINIVVQRRTGKRPLVAAPVAPVAKPIAKTSSKSQGTSKQDTEFSNPFERPSSSSKTSKSTTQAESKSELKNARVKEADKKATPKPANLKREQSDLFKSFSKPKAKLTEEDTGSSAGNSPPTATEPSVNTTLHFRQA